MKRLKKVIAYHKQVKAALAHAPTVLKESKVDYRKAIIEVTDKLNILVEDLPLLEFTFNFNSDGSIDLDINLINSTTMLLSICLDDFSKTDSYKYYATYSLFSENRKQLSTCSGDIDKVINHILTNNK